MAERQRQYTSEFKQEAVRLSKESGKSQAQVARELGMRAEMEAAGGAR
jgi:transposase-like protein